MTTNIEKNSPEDDDKTLLGEIEMYDELVDGAATPTEEGEVKSWSNTGVRCVILETGTVPE